MCCRTRIFPYDPEVAALILAIGQFVIEGGVWRRRIEDEGVSVNAQRVADELELSLTPAISIYGHHAGRRISGGVMFEIAARYAEKVGGRIVQHSNVAGCSETGMSSRLLAEYPEMPLSFERCCNGFREALLEGVHNEFMDA